MTKWKLVCPNGHRTSIFAYNYNSETREHDFVIFCRGVKTFDKDEYDCKCEYSKWQKVDFADII